MMTSMTARVIIATTKMMVMIMIMMMTQKIVNNDVQNNYDNVRYDDWDDEEDYYLCIQCALYMI